MASKQPAILNPTPEDISILLAAQTHIGTKNCEKAMLPYVHKRRADGIHLINIGKTWETIVFAARVLAARNMGSYASPASGRFSTRSRTQEARQRVILETCIPSET